MAVPTEAQIAHQQLLDQLDMHSIHKTFRNPHWRPNQRRNKNIKSIVGDVTKREAASALATPRDNSGALTPQPPVSSFAAAGTAAADADESGPPSTSGASTPAVGNPGGPGPNLAQASRSLAKLVLEKTLRPAASAAAAAAAAASAAAAANTNGGGGGPSATYTNIESAPSLAHAKRYCDVTGLAAPYVDPKTRMRYHDREVFAFVRGLPQAVAEQYLEARGAHTVLK